MSYPRIDHRLGDDADALWRRERAATAPETYLLVLRNPRIAKLAAAELEDLLAAEHRRGLALVPPVAGTAFAEWAASAAPADRRRLSAWCASHLPEGAAPVIVGLDEDGLAGWLRRLGLTAYVGIPAGGGAPVGLGVLSSGSDGTSLGAGGRVRLVPVSTAQELVETVARATAPGGLTTTACLAATQVTGAVSADTAPEWLPGRRSPSGERSALRQVLSSRPARLGASGVAGALVLAGLAPTAAAFAQTDAPASPATQGAAAQTGHASASGTGASAGVQVNPLSALTARGRHHSGSASSIPVIPAGVNPGGPMIPAGINPGGPMIPAGVGALPGGKGGRHRHLGHPGRPAASSAQPAASSAQPAASTAEPASPGVTPGWLPGGPSCNITCQVIEDVDALIAGLVAMPRSATMPAPTPGPVPFSLPATAHAKPTPKPPVMVPLPGDHKHAHHGTPGMVPLPDPAQPGPSGLVPLPQPAQPGLPSGLVPLPQPAQPALPATPGLLPLPQPASPQISVPVQGTPGGMSQCDITCQTTQYVDGLVSDLLKPASGLENSQINNATEPLTAAANLVSTALSTPGGVPSGTTAAPLARPGVSLSALSGLGNSVAGGGFGSGSMGAGATAMQGW